MISQTAEYALRAVVFLATCDVTPTNRQAIAAATQVPSDYLNKVLQELDRANIVTAKRGPGGGYSLSVSADNLSVYQVIGAVAALPRIEKCPLGIAGHTTLCPLHRRLDEAAAIVEQMFQQTSIAELVPPRLPRSACAFPKSP